MLPDRTRLATREHGVAEEHLVERRRLASEADLAIVLSTLRLQPEITAVLQDRIWVIVFGVEKQSSSAIAVLTLGEQVNKHARLSMCSVLRCGEGAKRMRQQQQRQRQVETRQATEA